jgi:hypothetical protein
VDKRGGMRWGWPRRRMEDSGGWQAEAGCPPVAREERAGVWCVCVRDPFWGQVVVWPVVDVFLSSRRRRRRRRRRRHRAMQMQERDAAGSRYRTAATAIGVCFEPRTMTGTDAFFGDGRTGRADGARGDKQADDDGGDRRDVRSTIGTAQRRGVAEYEIRGGGRGFEECHRRRMGWI